MELYKNRIHNKTYYQITDGSYTVADIDFNRTKTVIHIHVYGMDYNPKFTNKEKHEIKQLINSLIDTDFIDSKLKRRFYIY